VRAITTATAPQSGDHLWQVLPGTHRMALHEMLPVLDRPSVLGSGLSVRAAVPTPCVMAGVCVART
jgi:hypothetical protein